MTFDEFLRRACPPLDLDWRKYRRRAARHRVRARMQELGLEDYGHYLRLLENDGTEAAALPDLMRVTVTRFFRDRERWRLLAQKVLPALLAAREPQLPLRAWSAGCAGGEEPYTLAILWLSEIAPLHPGCTLRILGTDIDRPSLERASEAVYESSELREVPEDLRNRWFGRRGHLWTPLPAAIRIVELAYHNLAAEPPPGRFDLICCRYLPFTYFRGERRLDAARRLSDALAPDGALMIGAREDLGAAAPLFDPWPAAAGFFQPKGS